MGSLTDAMQQGLLAVDALESSPILPADATALTNSEYVAMQSRLELIAQLAVSTDPHTLDLFIQQAERATSLGPLLDPSLYMLGGEKLRGVITHARALARFAAAIRETL